MSCSTRVLVAFILLAATAGAEDAPPSHATTEEATRFGAHAATVLLFVYTDCPIANGMAPEIQRIHEHYRGRDVAFFRVYADSFLSDADLDKHGRDYRLTMPAVRDKDLALVKLTGAEVTPEAVIYDRAGKRCYRGRINNRYEDLGKYRQEATVNDLRDALDAVLAGKEVPHPETKAVGCFLPKLEPEPEPRPKDATEPSK